MDTPDLQALRDDTARTVMGWHSRPIPWAYDGTADLWHDAQGTPLLTVHAWQPDADDGQCMQVLERMLELGFSLHMDCDGNGCRVRFDHARRRAARSARGERRLALLEAALEAISAAGE